ncbi:hypothetical protein JR316_0006279 [Psilocybe cubensis]|uniref:Uncharacterized protein n=1 Tax=Psilocybe cubensis TaxID=181762 RepID=A0ACB8H285_PSICU|nr:hypothetical protein JR316_0006279 [Psilocybe cubensis]KAH9481752.1 hypothetical protein JR316_0006279 [Psilocybe cubensis]
MGKERQVTVDDFLDREFKQWEKAHVKMKDAPPPDGHDYLKHANNLLALLEAVGVPDINPSAKLVMTSFKAAVAFEQDRRENDARVTAVFLAQTDVMRVLLDVDGLSNKRRNRSNTEMLRSEATLNDILLAVQKEIKAFRLELQQTLSIQVASNVEDLVAKMDTVLSRFFTPKSDWEKNLDVKTRNLGSPSTWIQNTSTLQSLISDTNDPSMPLPAPAYEDSSASMSMSFGTEMQLSNIKKELQLSVDDLCDKNMDMFELKLSFHTQQMEKAIADSAILVIQSLSGPCDRVVNEVSNCFFHIVLGLIDYIQGLAPIVEGDGKSIMAHHSIVHTNQVQDWIFCVENKFFISALFEFYLDRFSTNRHIPAFNKKDNTDSATDSKKSGYS